jgi:bacillithiol biosynthesis cysteine-adding enzyme BshC
MSGRDLVSDYASNAGELLGFYGGPLASLWEACDSPPAWNVALLEELRAYEGTRGCSGAFRGNEAVIVTGQQPGIFTGPLYTIYKAITAIRVAALHSERTGVPTVPVFWVGGEDHDFDEARTTWFLSRRHTVESVSYAPTAHVDGLPMFRVPIEPSLHDAIDVMAAQTPGSEFTEPVAQMLHETLDAADSLSDWTARLMARLFDGTPLVLFTPDLPAARRIGAEVIARELDEPLETTRMVNAQGVELAKLGYETQVVKADNECSFFLEVDGRRRKVLFEKGAFSLPEEDRTMSGNELRALLDASPERFSPNVALRCIVQQRLFPVRAYVAGPGELAYWAQLRPVFERHEAEMPVVYPRARALLTTSKLNKLMRKLNLDLASLDAAEDDVVLAAQRGSGNNAALGRVQESQGTLTEELARLSEGLAKVSATAASRVDAMKGELERGFGRVEQAILREDTQKDAATRQHVQRLCNSLRPLRKSQERVFTVFSFLFEQGPDLIQRLLAELDVESFGMNEIEL